MWQSQDARDRPERAACARQERRAQSLLILSPADDFHAELVAAALTAQGMRVLRLDLAELPLRGQVSLRFGDQHGATLVDAGDPIDLGDIDVVWNRRPQTPRVPDLVATEDRKFALDEWRQFGRAVLGSLAGARWINPRGAATAAECKPLQLTAARQVGLHVPATLISNDPDAIRAFLDAHADAIYKPLFGHVWHQHGRERATYTAAVRHDLLPSDAMLRAVPGIFQQRIEKDFEVRAQFFGGEHFAVRIESQQLKHGELDWRLHQFDMSDCASIRLPQQIASAAQRLLQELGLVAGGFDFIVDRSGQWHFLEVNQAGQFLMLERWCPSLPVLAAFCAFVRDDSAADHSRDEAPSLAPMLARAAAMRRAVRVASPPTLPSSPRIPLSSVTAQRDPSTEFVL